MCWNKEVSIISFFIGTIINIFSYNYFKSIQIKAICIIWQWVLTMQLCEAFIWHDQNCGEINKFATKGAFIFNITQPIVVFLVCINMFTIDPEIKYLASFIILMYICYMLYSSNKNNEYICTKNSNTCFHLELPWWNNIISSVFYIGTLISISLLIFKPLNTAIAIVMFLLFTLFLSSVFYSCGAPSMWCWLVVPFPIIIGFIDSGLNKNIQ